MPPVIGGDFAGSSDHTLDIDITRSQWALIDGSADWLYEVGSVTLADSDGVDHTYKVTLSRLAPVTP